MAYIRPVYGRKAGGPGQSKPIGYEVRYRDADGVQRTKGGFRRKRDAEAYAVDVESSRQQGTLIPHERASARFDEVAAAWLASIDRRRKPKTVDGYRGLLEVHVLAGVRNPTGRLDLLRRCRPVRALDRGTGPQAWDRPQRVLRAQDGVGLRDPRRQHPDQPLCSCRPALAAVPRDAVPDRRPGASAGDGHRRALGRPQCGSHAPVRACPIRAAGRDGCASPACGPASSPRYGWPTWTCGPGRPGSSARSRSCAAAGSKESRRREPAAGRWS